MRTIYITGGYAHIPDAIHKIDMSDLFVRFYKSVADGTYETLTFDGKIYRSVYYNGFCQINLEYPIPTNTTVGGLISLYPTLAVDGQAFNIWIQLGGVVNPICKVPEMVTLFDATNILEWYGLGHLYVNGSYYGATTMGQTLSIPPLSSPIVTVSVGSDVVLKKVYKTEGATAFDFINTNGQFRRFYFKKKEDTINRISKFDYSYSVPSTAGGKVQQFSQSNFEQIETYYFEGDATDIWNAKQIVASPLVEVVGFGRVQMLTTSVSFGNEKDGDIFEFQIKRL